MNIKAAIILSFITLLFVSACNLIWSEKRELPPLKFAYSAWVGYYPIAIAQEKGFFTKQGVNVQIIFLGADEPQLANLVAGKYDGMITTLGNVISAGTDNSNLRIVLKIDQSAGADVIVAQPQIKSVADLKGKKIGVDLGKFGELFVTKMLESNGLTTDQVTLSKTNEEQVLTRLKSNEIQAGHTWEPFASQAVKAGWRVIFTSAQTPGLISDVITFRETILKTRPADIRAFIRAWFQSVDYWKANPKEGNAIIGKVLKIPPETISLEGVKLLTLEDNKKGFIPGNTTDSLYHTAQLYANFYIRTGGLTRPPDMNKLIEPFFLQ
ncbi:MAG: ABC transporter substrate-binding protein [Potamolinea sp.]